MWTRRAVMGATTLALTELGLRGLGRGPWIPAQAAFSVTPADWLQADPQVGVLPADGRFAFTFSDGRTFSASHAAHRRVVAPGTGRVVHLHGCSWTYGFGVDDEQTFASRLARLQGWQVVNFGVPSHGLAQVWVRATAALREDPPDLIVVGYASFLDERTAALRHWRRALASASARLEAGPSPATWSRFGRPRMFSVETGFEPGWGSTVSAVAHAVDRGVDRAEAHWVDARRVGRNLLLELSKVSALAGVRFVVAQLDQAPQTIRNLAWCRARGVEVVDASVDSRDPAWTLLPVDPHPNAAAHARIAAAIGGVV